MLNIQRIELRDKPKDKTMVKPIFRDPKNSREPDLRDLPSLSKLRA